MKIPFNVPTVTGREIKYVSQCMANKKLSGEGKAIKINYLIVYMADKNINIAAKRFIRMLCGPGKIDFFAKVSV